MADETQFWVEKGLGILLINRPAAPNALNWAAQEQFADAVAAVAGDKGIRVLIISAVGSKAFASGGDLKELAGFPGPDSGARLNRIMGQALETLTQMPVPVIGAVNGDAIGGGCEILTACDLRMSSGHARFRFPQVQVGLTTGWGGTGRLVRLLGQSRAADLLLTGRTFSAREALDMGFIHRLLAAEEDVLPVARIWAEQLAALPRNALAATKTLLHAAGSSSIGETNALEARLFVELWPQEDHGEAVRAFLERRSPRFK